MILKKKRNDCDANNIYKYIFNFDIIEKQIKQKKIKDGFNERKLYYILNYLMTNQKGH